MTVRKLKIAGTDLNSIVNYLISELSFDYENHSVDMSILLGENINFQNPSGQTNMVILRKEQTAILIDIIASGGSIGILGVVGNTEEAYINKVARVIKGYGEENQLAVVEQE